MRIYLESHTRRAQLYNFVFVRKDIPLADQLVQVGHVCMKAGMEYGTPATEPSMVLIEIENVAEL